MPCIPRSWRRNSPAATFFFRRNLLQRSLIETLNRRSAGLRHMPASETASTRRSRSSGATASARSLPPPMGLKTCERAAPPRTRSAGSPSPTGRTCCGSRPLRNRRDRDCPRLSDRASRGTHRFCAAFAERTGDDR
jgi:hypothetical protein